ncbi:hypothetical protein PMAYCL1PPCAC_22328 [Pristionchus mayeri]|uniref:CUB domain-containing protein n=1 Tax=Pristionchus mayeri TaxID=1317129 RepID=A0AAN5CWK8_9BILA|nr:hypothetical protein PMAYCL1PPCAC_22328 [Pristionchus mayeri]
MTNCHPVCDSASVYYDVFCIAQLQPPPTPSTDCGSFNDDSEDSVCYEIAANAEDCKDAQAICHSFGAASVHSEQQNSYIRRLAVSRGAVNGVLLGAILSGKGNGFGWVDGSDWEYVNFHQGFSVDGFGDCLSMDTITTAEDIPEQNGCTSGPWKDGQIIYSPGFPNDATVSCEYFLTVDSGSRVRLEILFLEANSCCDFLMVTDGYIGGEILANLTGEFSGSKAYYSSANMMRVIWQPGNGVGVRGMMMTYSIY